MAMHHPDVSRFLTYALEAFDPRQNVETFWKCESALELLLEGNGLVESLNAELQSLLPDSARLGDWLPDEWVLHRGGGTVLSVLCFQNVRRYIHGLPFLGLYGVLGQQELRYHRYRLPEGFRNELFDPRQQLLPDGFGVVRPGEILRIESGTYAYDFDIQQPVLVAKFVTTPVWPLEWLFSKSNLQAWQANDADLSFTQMRVAADVLGKIAHQSSAPYLQRLSEYPHHSVRWAAIRNLARIDRAEALVRIQRALEDPHPHVRRAAQRTLDQSSLKK